MINLSPVAGMASAGSESLLTKSEEAVICLV